MAYLNEAEQWQAVVSRDPRADGAFLYAVKTTGIYCRPTCSSRLPRQENVIYFSNSSEAEAAGYRACKRCRPNGVSLDEQRTEVVVSACKIIETAEEPPQLEELAAAVGVSSSHLHRLFKEVVGVTPREYAAALRMRRFKSGLQEDAPVTQAIYDAGFNSSSRFYEASSEVLGMTPTKYRKGGAGLQIRHSVVETSLGWMLVAATDRGICSIEFGDSPELLADRLQERFPEAELTGDEAGFGEWVSQVTAFVETPALGLDLPLDIQGTAFQQRVWKALRGIPAGTTKSYTEVAQQIGKPTAVRAVASACAANKIAVAIPCHRVLRSDGELGGYRWGIERKQALLEREAAETI